ncbi:MAG: hypothetical protein WC343_03845 [Bacilli bacterium]|jgi:hypothetical protein
MRKYLILFAICLLLAVTASADWYPKKIDQGTLLQTDTGANNIEGLISIQTIPAAETADVDQICNDVSLNSTTKLLINSTGVGSSNFLDDPDVPRCIIVTPSDVVSTAIKFTGLDIAGTVITENLTFSASSSAQTTTKAFKNVTRIDATTTGTTRTADIGVSDKLGLNTKLSTNTVLLAALDNTLEGTAPAVTVSSTVLAQNTIDTSGAPAGKVTKVWFVV